MRKQLVTLKPFSYAGRALKAGTDFEAGGRDARLLVAIGKARYQTRVMTAGDAPAPTAKTPARKAPAKKAAAKTAPKPADTPAAE